MDSDKTNEWWDRRPDRIGYYSEHSGPAEGERQLTVVRRPSGVRDAVAVLFGRYRVRVDYRVRRAA